jgi:TRAP-type uncharacterized transport system substrate-binding protein
MCDGAWLTRAFYVNAALVGCGHVCRGTARNTLSSSLANKTYDFPYHPGAVKYFKDKNIKAKAFP